MSAPRKGVTPSDLFQQDKRKRNPTGIDLFRKGPEDEPPKPDNSPAAIAKRQKEAREKEEASQKCIAEQIALVQEKQAAIHAARRQAAEKAAEKTAAEAEERRSLPSWGVKKRANVKEEVKVKKEPRVKEEPRG